MVVSGIGAVVIGGVGPFGQPSTIDHVPNQTDYVGTVDGRVAIHPTTERLVNASLQDRQHGPSSYAEIVDTYQNQTTLDASKFRAATIFGKDDSEQPYVGAVIRAKWDRGRFVETIDNQSPSHFSETTYNGVTIYQATNSTYDYAALGYGLYVVGSTAAVTDVIDVAAGESAPLDGGLREVYDETRSDGFVRIAVKNSATRLNQVTRSLNNRRVNRQLLSSVNYVGGSYYAVNDNTVGVRVQMHVDNESRAADVEGMIRSGFVLLQQSGNDNLTLKESIDEASVSRSSTRVEVTYEEDLQTLVKIITYLRGTP